VCVYICTGDNAAERHTRDARDKNFFSHTRARAVLCDMSARASVLAGSNRFRTRARSSRHVRYEIIRIFFKFFLLLNPRNIIITRGGVGADGRTGLFAKYFALRCRASKTMRTCSVLVRLKTNLRTTM